jgi:nitrogen fixation/metabolism regulation signal transduction histidine kinase
VKTVRIHRKHFFINVRGLILIYILLCILTVLFSRTFFITTLQSGTIPEVLLTILVFTIPAALLVFLIVSVVNLIRDYIARRTGSLFQVRLFAYFIVTVFFAAVPVTIITVQSAREMLNFWRSIQIHEVLEDAQDFALDT